MAASETSQTTMTTTTASTFTPVTARGTHVLMVASHSLHKGLGLGHLVRSATFAVGGYQWSIRYYPDGSTSTPHADRVVVDLELMSKRSEVRAHFDFRLVDQATGKAMPIHRKPTPVVLFSTAIDADDAGGAGNNKRPSWGTFSIRKASEIEASSYLLDDCLIIQCNVTVIGDPRVEETAVVPGFEVRVPAPDLSDNLGRLLEGKRGADVTFRVRDELFQAHKVVLATRSPVFDAEFFGPMAEEDTTARPYLTIEDMHPDVFRALLHFVYTDSMPSLEGFDARDSREMVRHLLVAADRYAMQRLKLICEGILFRSLVAEDVATSLALADMHSCHHLRNACIALKSSLDKTDNDDVARQEYEHPKIAFPTVLLDVLDNMRKWMFSCLYPR